VAQSFRIRVNVKREGISYHIRSDQIIGRAVKGEITGAVIHRHVLAKKGVRILGKAAVLIADG